MKGDRGGQKTDSERLICLVPELCYLTGLSDKLRNDFRAMRTVREHTSLGPVDRVASIEQFLARVNNTQSAREELLKWGLELAPKTTVTPARTFPNEQIEVGNRRSYTTNEAADFTREATGNPVIRPVNIDKWLMLFTNRDQQKAESFHQKLVECGKKLGMRIARPDMIKLNDDRCVTFKNAVTSAIDQNTQLVVFLFPSSRDDRYNTVKKLCCVDIPVPSQVLLSKTFPDDSKVGKFRSVTMKVALQINCKLGGELWAVKIPLSGLMCCGIDVYHDPSSKGMSVAAFVASTNKLMTRWYSKAVLQKPHQEVIDALKCCFVESIKKYHEVNHALPDRIVIYRDGVGDGRLKQVAEYEVEQLTSCFGMFDSICDGGKYNPKLSVIIVSKRINVRFFSAAQRQLTNPPPGTVLDHVATKHDYPDFFLVSQHVRQGTVSPTHYIVISGSEYMKPDHVQRLSYKMTHMYYNWPGTVRVPAPCQYAHKLAYLVGENIRAEPSNKLCDRLFYL